MKIEFVELQNFRKLKSCRIDFAPKETVFVGANNSGKTSAMDALIAFLRNQGDFTTRDFTLSNWRPINKIGSDWLLTKEGEVADLSIASWENLLPQLDIWLRVGEDEIHYINHLIPTLDWDGGLLGVRMRFEPKNIEELHKEFSAKYKASHSAKEAARSKSQNEINLDLWPKNIWDFLEERLNTFFEVKSYILDPGKLEDTVDGVAKSQALPENSVPLEKAAFKGLVRVDIINAQRGFYDANAEGAGGKTSGNLSTQLTDYYRRHLDPTTEPQPDDIAALESLDIAKKSFDERLNYSFEGALKELSELNYPGFGNPTISLSSRVSAIDGLSHPSAVQFGVLEKQVNDGDSPFSLPEKYNGLGYQNLISMVFKLIRFRDDWMKVGKSLRQITNTDDDPGFEPLHLVLVEEPEAHLHAQVQQVFIRKAYDVLRNHKHLGTNDNFSTQLVISTHSNHIAHEIDFTCLRYFKRGSAPTDKMPTSTVVNLSKTFGNELETTKFAVRYLKTTHCDLFFADAVVLIEGPAERMLVPHFIKHSYKDLATCYISLLEIGGSHAHTLKPLIEDLALTALVVTDVDTVDPANKGRSVFPERAKGYASGNTTVKTWLPAQSSYDVLLEIEESKKQNDHLMVAYQTSVTIEGEEALPYTFEDTLVLTNLELFKTIEGIGLIKKMRDAANLATLLEKRQAMYTALTASGVKKAEFALELLYYKDPTSIVMPEYIKKGLDWLHSKLKSKKDNFHKELAPAP